MLQPRQDLSKGWVGERELNQLSQVNETVEHHIGHIGSARPDGEDAVDRLTYDDWHAGPSADAYLRS